MYREYDFNISKEKIVIVTKNAVSLKIINEDKIIATFRIQ